MTEATIKTELGSFGVTVTDSGFDIKSIESTDRIENVKLCIEDLTPIDGDLILSETTPADSTLRRFNVCFQGFNGDDKNSYFANYTLGGEWTLTGASEYMDYFDYEITNRFTEEVSGMLQSSALDGDKGITPQLVPQRIQGRMFD
jgi:hypothetical protein